MEDLRSLMFELSNTDRLRIMLKLNEEAMTATSLSRCLDLTIQEVSRHLKRLERVGLTRKDVEGSHHVSSFGWLFMKQLGALEFISDHRDYFDSHSTESIPEEFLGRLGELSGSRRMQNIMFGFHKVEEMLGRAEEYVWAMIDEDVLLWPVVAEATKRGVEVRIIYAGFVTDPQYAVSVLNDEVHLTCQKARVDGLLRERFLERCDLYLFVSEKEVGALAFPLPGGGFDYLGFSSEDESARRWCREIFLRYWDTTEDLMMQLDRLQSWINNRPRVLDAFKRIVGGKHPVDAELVSELEGGGFLKEGRPTLLGMTVLHRPVLREQKRRMRRSPRRGESGPTS